jgi:hypothetical protein
VAEHVDWLREVKRRRERGPRDEGALMRLADAIDLAELALAKGIPILGYEVFEPMPGGAYMPTPIVTSRDWDGLNDSSARQRELVDSLRELSGNTEFYTPADELLICLVLDFP